MVLVVELDDPRAPDVHALLAVHLAFSHGVTEPGHVHALDLDALRAPSISFFSARRSGQLLGVGALRHLDPTHAEIKSMHVAKAGRGQGIGRAIVDHLIRVATQRGVQRISLETGRNAAFAPARQLYLNAGFTECPPFGDYTVNEHSICMTRLLTPRVP